MHGKLRIRGARAGCPHQTQVCPLRPIQAAQHAGQRQIPAGTCAEQCEVCRTSAGQAAQVILVIFTRQMSRRSCCCMRHKRHAFGSCSMTTVACTTTDVLHVLATGALNHCFDNNLLDSQLTTDHQLSRLLLSDSSNRHPPVPNACWPAAHAGRTCLQSDFDSKTATASQLACKQGYSWPQHMLSRAAIALAGSALMQALDCHLSPEMQ